jgi:hypothetical protein
MLRESNILTGGKMAYAKRHQCGEQNCSALVQRQSVADGARRWYAFRGLRKFPGCNAINYWLSVFDRRLFEVSAN